MKKRTKAMAVAGLLAATKGVAAASGLSATEADVEAVVKKLHVWSSTLPTDQQAVLQVMLDRLAGTKVGDVEGMTLRGDMKPAISTMLQALATPGGFSAGWVKGGDPWVQSKPK